MIIVERVYQALDQNDKSGAVVMDIAKASDRVILYRSSLQFIVFLDEVLTCSIFLI